MSCVVKRHILDNLCTAQTAVVIGNENRGQKTKENKCYAENLRSEYGYITKLLFQSGQPLGLLSVLVRRERCGEKTNAQTN